MNQPELPSVEEVERAIDAIMDRSVGRINDPQDFHAAVGFARQFSNLLRAMEAPDEAIDALHRKHAWAFGEASSIYTEMLDLARTLAAANKLLKAERDAIRKQAESNFLSAMHTLHGTCGHCGKRECAGKDANSVLDGAYSFEQIRAALDLALINEKGE